VTHCRGSDERVCLHDSALFVTQPPARTDRGSRVHVLGRQCCGSATKSDPRARLTARDGYYVGDRWLPLEGNQNVMTLQVICTQGAGLQAVSEPSTRQFGPLSLGSTAGCATRPSRRTPSRGRHLFQGPGDSVEMNRRHGRFRSRDRRTVWAI